MNFQSSKHHYAKQYITIAEFKDAFSFSIWFQFKVLKKFSVVQIKNSNHQFMPILVNDINGDSIKLNLWNKDIKQFSEIFVVNKMYEIQNFRFNAKYQNVSLSKNVKIKKIDNFTVLFKNKLCVQNKKQYVNITNTDQVAITNYFRRKILEPYKKKNSVQILNHATVNKSSSEEHKEKMFNKSDLKNFLKK